MYAHRRILTTVVPLTVQALLTLLLCICMFICNEFPRWLTKADLWERATAVLSRARSLPPTHPYIQGELSTITEQLEHERLLTGCSTLKDLLCEM